MEIVGPEGILAGHVRVTEGIRPGVVGANYSFGQQGYAARAVAVDGEQVGPAPDYLEEEGILDGDEPGKQKTGFAGGRGRGFCMNELLPDDGTPAEEAACATPSAAAPPSSTCGWTCARRRSASPPCPMALGGSRVCAARPAQRWFLAPPGTWHERRAVLPRTRGNRLERAAFSKIRGFRLPALLPAVKSLLHIYERYSCLTQLSRRRFAHGRVPRDGRGRPRRVARLALNELPRVMRVR